MQDMQEMPKKLSMRKVMVLAMSAVLVVSSPFLIFGAVEDLDAQNIMVVQYPWGKLAVFTEQGPKMQWWGSVTKYPRRVQYSFSSSKDQGGGGDQSISTGFNDGGKGSVSGVMSWQMPLTEDHVVRLHKQYGSAESIEQQLIRPMLEKVIFGTGATMSSFESNSERKSEIPQTIDDQLQNGPFLTKVVITNTKDELTKEEKTVRSVQVATDASGKPIRSSTSTIREYGILLSPVTVNNIEYETKVKEQIAERQKSTQAVQLSMAAAVRATQDAITTEQQGRADAAKAKWTQETINAKEVAEAEKNKKVAELEAQTAEATKKRLILEGEGEATKKRLVMEADGGLVSKVDAYITVNKAYADAISKYQGQWVPSVVMGDKEGVGATGAQQMIDMLTVKTAKDLAIDMSISGKSSTSNTKK